MLDVLQWVTRLPMTLSAEPRRPGHALTLSSMISALAARSGGVGRSGPDAMLVQCRSLQTALRTLALMASLFLLVADVL